MPRVDVRGYEGLYTVDDLGVVYGQRGNPLKPSYSHSGHRRVILYDTPNRKPKTASVHKVVKESFHGPTPVGMWVLHNDGNPSNNSLANLRFGTPSENNHDKVRHGNDHNSRKTHCPRGHSLTGDNLRGGDGRRCKACHRARSDRFNGHPGTLQELSDKQYAKITGH